MWKQFLTGNLVRRNLIELRDDLPSGASTILRPMPFTAVRRYALTVRGGHFCRNGTSIPQLTLRVIIRDCGDGRETNLDYAMTSLDISSSARKMGLCCLAKLRWFDAGCELKAGVDGRGRPSLQQQIY